MLDWELREWLRDRFWADYIPCLRKKDDGEYEPRAPLAVSQAFVSLFSGGKPERLNTIHPRRWNFEEEGRQYGMFER